MTTMKDGPGDDPFADDEPKDESKATDNDVPETEPEPDTEPMSKQDFPYVMRRERVKDDRPNEHVAFLRDEYSDPESDVRGAVASEMDMREKDLSVIDLREAFVELADRHPDELAEILDEWGYEYR